MRHALIVDTAMMLSRSLEDLLVSLGFRSFEHCWDAAQADDAARRKFPELVVLGGGADTRRALEAVRRVAAGRPLMVFHLATRSPEAETSHAASCDNHAYGFA